MAVIVRPVGRPGDLGWIVQAHGETYAREYSWHGAFEAMVTRIVADFAENQDPTREAGWIAELDGRRAGCVFCVAQDATTARLRVLLVEPFARGHRIGSRLVDECLAFARGVGYRRMTLFTTSPLVAARAIYVSRGFGLTHEEPHDSFGQPMLSQRYDLDLA
jgi:GNAT superfamily N-acetyltransferase